MHGMSSGKRSLSEAVSEALSEAKEKRSKKSAVPTINQSATAVVKLERLDEEPARGVARPCSTTLLSERLQHFSALAGGEQTVLMTLMLEYKAEPTVRTAERLVDAVVRTQQQLFYSPTDTAACWTLSSEIAPLWAQWGHEVRAGTAPEAV